MLIAIFTAAALALVGAHPMQLSIVGDGRYEDPYGDVVETTGVCLYPAYDSPAIVTWDGDPHESHGPNRVIWGRSGLSCWVDEIDTPTVPVPGWYILKVAAQK
jgi:hypothetical protein